LRCFILHRLTRLRRERVSPSLYGSLSGACVSRNAPKLHDVHSGHHQRVRRRVRGCVIHPNSPARRLNARTIVVRHSGFAIAMTCAFGYREPARATPGFVADFVLTPPPSQPTAPAAKAGKKVTARSAAAKCVPPATHQQGLRKISSERRSGRAREEEASFFSCFLEREALLTSSARPAPKSYSRAATLNHELMRYS